MEGVAGRKCRFGGSEACLALRLVVAGGAAW